MRYLITGTKSSMQLTVGYDERGLLCEVLIVDAVDEKAVDWTVRNVPIMESHVHQVFAAAHLKITVLQVSFRDFWVRYGYKEGKVDCERAWNALSPADQQLAHNYAQRYRESCARDGRKLQYPATYLRAKRWLDHT